MDKSGNDTGNASKLAASKAASALVYNNNKRSTIPTARSVNRRITAIDAKVPLQYPANRTITTTVEVIDASGNDTIQHINCNTNINSGQRNVDGKLRVLSVEYGGLWKDVYEELLQTRSMNQRLQEENARLQVACTRLQDENSQVLSRFKGTLCSLTETESFHLEALQVLEQIRLEKEVLLSRVIAYESHQQWLEKQHSALQLEHTVLQTKRDTLEQQLLSTEHDLRIVQHQLHDLETLVKTHETEFTRVQVLLQESVSAQEALQRAYNAKNTRFAALVKEKQQLQDQLAVFQNSQHLLQHQQRKMRSRSRAGNSSVSRPRIGQEAQSGVISSMSTSNSATLAPTIYASPLKGISKEMAVTPTGVVEGLYTVFSPPLLPPAAINEAQNAAIVDVKTITPPSPLPTMDDASAAEGTDERRRKHTEIEKKAKRAETLDLKTLLKRFQHINDDGSDNNNNNSHYTSENAQQAKGLGSVGALLDAPTATDLTAKGNVNNPWSNRWNSSQLAPGNVTRMSARKQQNQRMQQAQQVQSPTEELLISFP